MSASEGGPYLQRYGPLVQLHGPRALQALRLIVLGTKARSTRDGIAMSAADRELIEALADAVEAAGMSPSGHADVPEVATPEALLVEGITTKEAAQMLELSPRQIRRLAPLLGGHKRGGVLVVDRDAVLTLAAEREAR